MTGHMSPKRGTQHIETQLKEKLRGTVGADPGPRERSGKQCDALHI